MSFIGYNSAVPEMGATDRLKNLVCHSVPSGHSRRAYRKALEDFLQWYGKEEREGFTRAVVQQYRTEVESSGLAPSSVNLRLSAIRKLASEAADNGLLAPEVAA